MPGTGWTAPRTWVAGEVVTAALLNTHVRDNLLAIGDPGVWTSFTGTLGLTQGVSLTASSPTADYTQIGKLVKGNVLAAITSAGTAAQQLQVTLPVSPRRNTSPFTIGTFTYLDASPGTFYQGSVAFLGTGAQARFFCNAQTDVFGKAPAITAASGDFLAFSFAYEAA